MGSHALANPVGKVPPQIFVVGVTEHLETRLFEVVEHAVEAEDGQDTHTSVTVVVAVHDPVPVVVTVVSWPRASHPYTVEHVDNTLLVVVIVAVLETETPNEVLVAHS